MFAGIAGGKLGGSQVQVQASQATGVHAQGDYDFAAIDSVAGPGMAFVKHPHHPARVITTSESGQVGIPKTL